MSGYDPRRDIGPAISGVRIGKYEEPYDQIHSREGPRMDPSDGNTRRSHSSVVIWLGGNEYNPSRLQ